MNNQYYVYIITNKNNTVLYTGVTNDMKRRMFEHKNKLIKGFSKKYNIDKLVYYELFDKVEEAISRERSQHRRGRPLQAHPSQQPEPEGHGHVRPHLRGGPPAGAHRTRQDTHRGRRLGRW